VVYEYMQNFLEGIFQNLRNRHSLSYVYDDDDDDDNGGGGGGDVDGDGGEDGDSDPESSDNGSEPCKRVAKDLIFF
jgi:hypothetical protein